MKVLHQYHRIFLTALMVILCDLALANPDPQTPDQDGTRSADQGLMQPDGEPVDLQEEFQTPSESSETESVEIEETNNESPAAKAPSNEKVENTSVSKYNFIFYFLYKFKYDTEEAP